MHPAFSVIFFTTFSGAGYGLLFVLGAVAPFGLLPEGPVAAVTAMALALAMVTAGLLSSTLHLKHPERAWRAVSQWRSSWLSREGIAALATYVPAGAFALAWALGDSHGVLVAIFGVLAAALAAVTVFCTAKIYASLKSIAAWHQPLVVPLYLLFALALGALWFAALAAGFGAGSMLTVSFALAVLVATWLVKLVYWRLIDTAAPASTANTATGLAGKVRAFDPPHTEANYLLREMGFRVARKHAQKLRRIALIIGLAVPALLVAGALGFSGSLGIALLCAAAPTATAGVLIERWLFFAEAKHTVGLYYGLS